MNIGWIFFIAISFIIVSLWAVYNFYWLGQPQLYNVVQTTISAFDKTTADSIATALGGRIGTIRDMYDAMNLGASNCYFGYAQCVGCSGISGPTALLCASGNCTGGYGPFNIRNIEGLTGSAQACGVDATSNHSIGGNGIGQAFGYWIYGPKPASGTITVNNQQWTIQPWINNGSLPTDGRNVFNRFQILGIPKIL